MFIRKEYIAAILWVFALSSHGSELDGTHLLSIAARKAVIACTAIEAFSIDDCSTRIGNSPAHKEARKAAFAAQGEMFAFMQSCKLGEVRCAWMADGLVMAGMSQAQ